MDRNRSLALLLESLDTTPLDPPPSAARFPSPEAFGEFLRSHRGGRNITLQQMSATTKIGVAHLEALERGDTADWPRGIYRRAIVRSYAAAVGLDPDDTVREFVAVSTERSAPVTPAAMHGAPPADAGEAIRQRIAGIAGRMRSRIRLQPQPHIDWRRLSGRIVGQVVWPLALVSLGYLGARGDLSVSSVTGGLDAVRLIADAPQPLGASAAAPVGTAGEQATTAPAATAATVSQVLVERSGPETDVQPVAAVQPAAAVQQRADIRPLAAEGQIVVTSRPSGARVTVNGTGWGSTPITIRHLALGDQVIRLSKDGYHSAERSVELTPDRSSRSLSIRLAPR